MVLLTPTSSTRTRWRKRTEDDSTFLASHSRPPSGAGAARSVDINVNILLKAALTRVKRIVLLLKHIVEMSSYVNPTNGFTSFVLLFFFNDLHLFQFTRKLKFHSIHLCLS